MVAQVLLFSICHLTVRGKTVCLIAFLFLRKNHKFLKYGIMNGFKCSTIEIGAHGIDLIGHDFY